MGEQISLKTFTLTSSHHRNSMLCIKQPYFVAVYIYKIARTQDASSQKIQD
jgi:hypothetical protein